MALKRRRFSREFTRQVVRAVEAGKPLAQAAREYQLHPTVIVRWHKAPRRYAEPACWGHGHRYTAAARIAELERLIGQLTMEQARLQKALLRLEGQVQPSASHGGR